MRSLFFLALFLPFSPSTKLLDKILAVADDQVYTLSQVRRMKENIRTRKQIAPFLYGKISKPTDKNLVRLMVQTHIARSKLNEMGYTVTNEQVEQQIRRTEKRLRLNRRALLAFLKKNKMTFDEYFELVRNSIEFSIFQDRVTKPLISVTDQEIRDAYYKKYAKKKAISLNYHLVDFSLPKKNVRKQDLKRLSNILKTFQKNGHLPERFKSLDSKDIGEIKEDLLGKNIASTVKKTKINSFSTPILIGKKYHLFYVKKKTFVSSNHFLKSKDRIYFDLFQKSSQSITELWFERESNKHYIKYFL